MGGLPDVNNIFKKCDELGEIEVRNKLAQNVYANNKVPVVKEWLKRQESAREAAVKEKEFSIAENSADATRVSAEAAMKSAKWAYWAMIIAAAMLFLVVQSMLFAITE